MDATLYELTETFKQIQSMVEDDGADEQVLTDTLDSIDWNEDFEEKCDSYVMVIRNTEVSIGADDGQIEAIEKILNDLKKSKAAKENKVRRMKESLCDAMVKVGRTKFRSSRFSFWTQKTTPTVVIQEEATVPMEYLILQEPKVDKKKIADDLKKGEKLDFARLESHDIVRFR